MKLGYKLDLNKEYTDLQMAKNIYIALKKEPIVRIIGLIGRQTIRAQ